MDVLNEVKTLLAEEFPPPDEVDLKDEDGIIGVVVSERFRKMDTMARQEMIWRKLDTHLKPKERRRISIIVAVTPEEKIGHTSI